MRRFGPFHNHYKVYSFEEGEASVSRLDVTCGFSGPSISPVVILIKQNGVPLLAIVSIGESLGHSYLSRGVPQALQLNYLRGVGLR